MEGVRRVRVALPLPLPLGNEAEGVAGSGFVEGVRELRPASNADAEEEGHSGPGWRRGGTRRRLFMMTSRKMRRSLSAAQRPMPGCEASAVGGVRRHRTLSDLQDDGRGGRAREPGRLTYIHMDTAPQCMITPPRNSAARQMCATRKNSYTFRRTNGIERTYMSENDRMDLTPCVVSYTCRAAARASEDAPRPSSHGSATST